MNFLAKNCPSEKGINKKNKKALAFARTDLARPGGFEPSTYRFVAGHSIH